ncbi:MAG: 4Fe-4S binding protein [Planctomycetes bacterium]|nr:4Fe-4S binding protein [Planctomycetota bacterium]
MSPRGRRWLAALTRPRRLMQIGFLVLTGWAVFRLGANAERWCPFGGVEALHTYFAEGDMPCSLGTSNFFALGGLLLLVLLVRRAFCSHLCPIGAVSEGVRGLGAALGLRVREVPRRLDRALSVLKYGLLAFLLWLTYRADELLFRAADPCYAMISRHGEDITFWAYVVLGAILLGALFLSLPFCRWLCPLAAVMNPLARFGLVRVRREASSCTGCARCDNSCPMGIAIAGVEEVRDASCTACLDCVRSCPRSTRGALAVGLPGSTRRWSGAVVPLVVLVVLVSVVAAAEAFPIPSFLRERGEKPELTRTLELEVEGLNCRGSANQLVYFLDRDDILEIPGYLAIEAWPAPPAGRLRLTFDPALTDEEAIKEAIVTPYFDTFEAFERSSPFRVVGYRPW